MRIDTLGQHAVQNYLRTTDFENGEVKIIWADAQDQWERRMFVSRPDNVVVQLLTAPNDGAINATLRLETSIVLGSGRTDIPVECPATFVPVEMRQTGMRGTGYGTREEAYGGADRESAATG